MLIEIAHPLRLLLIPACAAVILAVALLQRSRSRKEKISHLLRYLLAVLTVLAMAGTSLSTASPEQASWLLIDIRLPSPRLRFILRGLWRKPQFRQTV